MTTVGSDQPLYVLPFDHRGSFQTKMFGWKGQLSPEQTSQVAAGVPKDKAGILVDEQFGGAILRHAAAEGYTLACPAEKSGQDEFDFEYGEDFTWHIETFQPTFCKVLVRFKTEQARAALATHPKGETEPAERSALHRRSLCSSE